MNPTWLIATGFVKGKKVQIKFFVRIWDGGPSEKKKFMEGKKALINNFGRKVKVSAVREIRNK